MIQINNMVDFYYTVTKNEDGTLLTRLMKSLGVKYGTRALEASIELHEIAVEDSDINIEGPQWGSTWDAGYSTKPDVMCYEITRDKVSKEMKNLIKLFNAEPIIKEDEKYIKGDK